MGCRESREQTRSSTFTNPVQDLMWEQGKVGDLANFRSLIRGGVDLNEKRHGYTLLGHIVLHGLNWEKAAYLWTIQKLILLGADPWTKMSFDFILGVSSEDEMLVEMVKPEDQPKDYHGQLVNLEDVNVVDLLRTVQRTLLLPRFQLSFVSTESSRVVTEMLTEGVKLVQGEQSTYLRNLFARRERVDQLDAPSKDYHAKDYHTRGHSRESFDSFILPSSPTHHHPPSHHTVCAAQPSAPPKTVG